MSKGDDFSYESSKVSPGAIFVEADEPLLIFPSIAAAERHLEAEDVRGGVYLAAYGPKGEPYRLGCDGDRVRIERIGGRNRPTHLKHLLLRYFEACEDPADATESLKVLVQRAWTIEREFWRNHDTHSERFAPRIPIWAGIAVLAAAGALLYLSLL